MNVQSTLFGDRAGFAIEAMVEPLLPVPSAVWGRMRIWCENTPIGNIDETCCALYPSYMCFGDLLTNLPHLWRSEFEDEAARLGHPVG